MNGLRPHRQFAQYAGGFSAFIRERDAAILDRDLAIVEHATHPQVRRLGGHIRQDFPEHGYAGTCRTDDTKRTSPSMRLNRTLAASNIRNAVSAIVSSARLLSSGVPAITRRMSAVAV